MLETLRLVLPTLRLTHLDSGDERRELKKPRTCLLGCIEGISTTVD